jgi:signal transduction histidine kinase
MSNAAACEGAPDRQAEAPGRWNLQRASKLVDRPLSLTVQASVEEMPGAHREAAWLRPLLALTGLALLCALLLASEAPRRQAEAASRAKSALLSQLSHDLRTPLNAVAGFAQLLSRDAESSGSPRRRDWAAQILKASRHLLNMMDETLDLAHIEAGSVKLHIASIELAAMVADCRSLIAGAAQEKRVTLDERLAPDAPVVLADATRVRQVMTNLLSNAVKYNHDGGRITLESRRREDGMVEIAVSDTGLGMTADQLRSLFQPYNRLGRESSGIDGTGIGLVITRQLTELMGGELDVQSKAGVGSTFTVRLPADVRRCQLAPAEL